MDRRWIFPQSYTQLVAFSVFIFYTLLPGRGNQRRTCVRMYMDSTYEKSHMQHDTALLRSDKQLMCAPVGPGLKKETH